MEIIKRNTDYALRALVHLATKPGAFFSAAEVASAQDIPCGFLQKLFQKCVKAGLVRSQKGPRGGFCLAGDPEEVTVADIVAIIQGPLTVNKCILGKNGCPRADGCPLKNRWLGIEAGIDDYMKSVTLKNLVDEMRGS